MVWRLVAKKDARPPQDRLSDGRRTCHSLRYTRGGGGGDAIKGPKGGSANDKSATQIVWSARYPLHCRPPCRHVECNEGGGDLLCHVSNNNGAAASREATSSSSFSVHVCVCLSTMWLIWE